MLRRTRPGWLLGIVCGLAITGPAEAARWADALFSEQAHDFGSVPRGAKVRHPFVMTNRLGETITIMNVRASCGCTSGRANATTVAPGQSATVEAEMDTRNFVGKKSTVLYVDVMTASRKQAEARLGVTSFILSDVVLNPGGIDFGTVTKGQTASQVLTIDRVDAPNWRIERMVSSSRVLNASLVETARNGQMVSYAMTVSLKPKIGAGIVRDEIRLMTNDPESPSFPVLVTAVVRGSLSASPSTLSLGNVTSAAGVQGRFVVRAASPFAIEKIEGVGDGFTAKVDDATKKTMHIVTVAYRPEESSLRGDLRRVFRVVTDLPGEGPLDLTATLHIEP